MTVTCECGQEFENATKRAVHQLSGNCSARHKLAPTGAKRRSGSSTNYHYKVNAPRLTDERLAALKARGQSILDNTYPSWHTSMSVYYKAPGTKKREPGKAVVDHLTDIEFAIRKVMMTEEFHDMVVKELGGDDDIEIREIRRGYNAYHCHLNQLQKMFPDRDWR